MVAPVIMGQWHWLDQRYTPLVEVNQAIFAWSFRQKYPLFAKSWGSKFWLGCIGGVGDWGWYLKILCYARNNTAGNSNSFVSQTVSGSFTPKMWNLYNKSVDLTNNKSKANKTEVTTVKLEKFASYTMFYYPKCCLLILKSYLCKVLVIIQFIFS